MKISDKLLYTGLFIHWILSIFVLLLSSKDYPAFCWINVIVQEIILLIYILINKKNELSKGIVNGIEYTNFFFCFVQVGCTIILYLISCIFSSICAFGVIFDDSRCSVDNIYLNIWSVQYVILNISLIIIPYMRDRYQREKRKTQNIIIEPNTDIV